MILIGDAGGTSTDWRIVREGNVEQRETSGFNFSRDNLDVFLSQFEETFTERFNEIHFYVAGLISEDQSDSLRQGLMKSQPDAVINIHNDTLGACRALCGKDAGWVGILGTGAALVHYDGDVIDERIPSLGYVIGDEGSGFDLGRQLIRDYFRHHMPGDIRYHFAKRFPYTEQEGLEKVWQEGVSFLSGFSRFLLQHKNHPYCYQLIADGFHRYFDAFVKDRKLEQPIHFNGGVAFYFADILRKVASEHNLPVRNVVESPIAGLTLYHTGDR